MFPGHDRMTKTAEGETSICLQWKGTNACMDINCKCGHHSHLDDFFAYNVRCAGCGRIYALSERIEAIELTPEEVADLKKRDLLRLVRTPEEVDLERANIEAMRVIQKMGGRVESEVKADEKDPTLMQICMSAHPPAGYQVVVLKTADVLRADLKFELEGPKKEG